MSYQELSKVKLAVLGAICERKAVECAGVPWYVVKAAYDAETAAREALSIYNDSYSIEQEYNRHE